MASMSGNMGRPESILIAKPSLRIEANEVVKEVAFAVKNAQLSESLENTDEEIFLNLETKESNKYCVRLSVQGFKVNNNNAIKSLKCQMVLDFCSWFLQFTNSVRLDKHCCSYMLLIN